jgi:probable F420-dependent oxidoreductase
MKFGLFFNPAFTSKQSVVRLVQRAEAIGYDSILTDDHIFRPDYWKRPGGDIEWEPFTILSYLAAKTSRIRLLLGCLVVPYRQPLAVAKAVASLDVLSDGRFILGAVPGYLPEEFSAFNLPLDERGAMTDEFLGVMKALWTQENASFSGRWYSFNNISMHPKPVQKPHPPIWSGGSSLRAVRRAIEYGDAWFPLAFPVVTEEYKNQYQKIIKGFPIPTGATAPADIRKGIAYGREHAKRLGKPYKMDVVLLTGFIQMTEEKSAAPAQMEGRTAEATREATPKSDVFRGSGTAEQLVREFKRYKAAGVDYFVVGFGGKTEQQFFGQAERFVKEVMPKV